MSVHSGNFPRLDHDLPHPGTWLGAWGRLLLAAATRPLASAAGWLEARARRRAARRAAPEEELRLEWWRSQ